MDAHDPALLDRTETPWGEAPDLPEASAWMPRLAPKPVLVANEGWIPGRVNFPVRGGDRDQRAVLRRALPDPQGGHVGNGHPRATGGSLPPQEFERLLAGLASA